MSKKKSPLGVDSSAAGKLQAPALDERRLNASLGGMLFGLLGLACVVCGLGIAFGPSSLVQLEPWIAQALELGASADVMLVGGLVLLALTWVNHAARDYARTQLRPGLAVSYLEDMAAEVSLLQGLAHELLGNAVEQGVQVSTLRKELLEHRQEVGVSNPKEALFRLAASLDQLGARIESRVGETTSAVHESTQAVTGAVESARNSVLDSVEHSAQQLSEIVYDAAQTLAQAQVQEDYVASRPPQGGQRYRLVEQDEEQEDEEGLSISVDFELEEEDEEPAAGTGPLGLLDQLEDGALRDLSADVPGGLSDASQPPLRGPLRPPGADDPGPARA